MRKKVLMTLFAIFVALTTDAQTAGLKKVYNEDIDPIVQIDQAVAKAKVEGKYVVSQVGGNWCPWCLKFADFITKDTTISKIIDDNFVYIHFNYTPPQITGRGKGAAGSSPDETTE